MIERGQDLEALLAAARKEFASRLEGKIDEIGELSTRLAWAEVRRAAHRLRGSAATYGFPKVGAVAAAMEEILIEANESPGDAAKSRFDLALRDARLEAVQAVRELK